jgi:PBP1b-binding outer membrane lipoprotein LpoB
MKMLIALAALLLSGCGLETAGSAATVGKLQADQARQAKDNMDAMKASLDPANKEAEARNRALEEAGKN